MPKAPVAGRRTSRARAAASVPEIRAGLIGFGTIGSGVVQLLQRRRTAIDAMLGARLRLVRIADLDTTRDRGVKTGGTVDTDFQKNAGHAASLVRWS